MNSNKLEKWGLFLFLGVLFLLQAYFLLLNEQVYGGADSISHFQIARYAFKHPTLFLDLWGKPVYTALVAPFTLFGFKFAQLFNLVTAIATLILLFRLSKTLYSPGAVFTPVFAAFAPVYFLLMLSCLTETLFSLNLVAAVFLFVKRKHIPSALVLSFIPFVRSEGMVLLPIFALAYILRRSYISILFLSFGTIFYSVIGYFVFNDLFWIQHQFPYQLDNDIYGSGELLHFVKNSNYIFGIPLIAITLIGLVYWIVEIFRNPQINNEKLILFLLIAGSWIGYFAAHSYVWWQGKSSLGLIRVIGGVIPLAALTATKGIQFIFETIKNKKISYITLIILALTQIILFFNKNQLPTKYNRIDELVIESSDYLIKENPEGKIFYFNPQFLFYLGIDPFDKTKSTWGSGDKLRPSNAMNYGDIIIWDAHFGPNEGRTALNALQNDPFLENIQSFTPNEEIIVLGGYKYSIHIFKKIRKSSLETKDILTRNLELENSQAHGIIDLNGEKILEIPRSVEYSPNIVVNVDELNMGSFVNVDLSLQYKSDEKINDKEVLLVISVEKGTDNFNYAVLPLTWTETDNNWKSDTLKTSFPGSVPESTIIKMYVWNKEHKHILIRNMETEIRGK